ncbi:MAG: sulfate/molybdate ABC transporter ATP-binding protein [Planctomycetes bacterium]|nr:sulfate/molybdate ABC transporter ATP-binding protein [Planctomycetota bacterium]
MAIEIKNLTKRFGDFTALSGLNLNIADGELVALLGPSGSGKTTLLRIIGGLEQAEEGEVIVDGANAGTVDIRDRRVGFVFQHYALFRHMTVFDNIAFGLRVRPRNERPGKDEISKRVHDLLKLVQLERLAPRYPGQLSGGQRQRVALARALAIEPKVLLLDEPFGALDAQVRRDLRRWLRRLHDEIKLTSVFVTHDQEEALEVADRVVVMNHGKIEQVGTPVDVYHRPATPFVYAFLGDTNVFHGRLEDGSPVLVGGEPPSEKQETARMYVRPHLMDIEHDRASVESVPAKVMHINAAGPTVKVELETPLGEAIMVELTQDRFLELKLERGTEVFATPRQQQLFKKDDYVI